jgi:hypothetical protein
MKEEYRRIYPEDVPVVLSSGYTVHEWRLVKELADAIFGPDRAARAYLTITSHKNEDGIESDRVLGIQAQDIEQHALDPDLNAPFFADLEDEYTLYESNITSGYTGEAWNPTTRKLDRTEPTIEDWNRVQDYIQERLDSLYQDRLPLCFGEFDLTVGPREKPAPELYVLSESGPYHRPEAE